MSIELFLFLNASVSGSTVTLTWDTTKTQGLAPITSAQIQSKPFGRGDDAWTNVGANSLLVWTIGGASVTPGLGDWSYRLALTTTQGGVGGAGTLVYSNEVNVTTEAATGEVHLSLGSRPSSGAGGGLPGYTEVILGFDIAGTAVDVKFWEVQRSLNSGPFRSVAELDEFEQGGSACTWSENLPAGEGTISYKVIAHLPSATPPYNADVLSTSSTVSITL